MRILFHLLFFAFIPVLGNTQDHDYIWLFGANVPGQPSPHSDSRLDFNFDPPVITQDPRTLSFYGNCAVMSDRDGKLLFYSNGKSVSSFNHSTMQNGGGLNPGDQASIEGSPYVISPQFILALPAPGSPNKYYLLHEPYKLFIELSEFMSFALLKTKVDMEGNNGLGIVVEKNQPIISDSLWLGKLSAVRHANGRDWWVLTNKFNSNFYYKVLVSPEGVSVVDTQIVGSPINDGLAQAVFSPDGSKFVMVNSVFDYYIQVFDFDRCTGELSNERALTVYSDIKGPGCAISSNSRFLYVSATDTIFQYDLWSDDIFASKEIVGIYDGHVEPFANNFYLTQLAPDGKIYISVPNGSNYLHVIEKPNERGNSCNFIQRKINLLNRNGSTVPNNPNYRLGPLDGSPCDTLGLDNHPVAKFRYDQDTSNYLQVAFTDLSYYEPAAWHWDFGDGSTSQDTSPVHTFPHDGLYEVCLTVSNQYDENTFCRSLQIGEINATGEVLPAVKVTLYPNPAAEAVNVILYDYLPRHAELRLYDALGKEVARQRLNGGWNVMPLEGIAPGMYFYEVGDGERRLSAGKLGKVGK